MPQAQTKQKREFENAIKAIKQCVSGKGRYLPTDENKLREYAERLVNAYNEFVENVSTKYPGFPRAKQALADDKFDNSHKPNLIKFLSVVGYEIEPPAGFNQIDIDSLKKSSANTTADPNDIDTSFTTSDLSDSDTEGNTKRLELVLIQNQLHYNPTRKFHQFLVQIHENLYFLMLRKLIMII